MNREPLAALIARHSMKLSGCCACGECADYPEHLADMIRRDWLVWRMRMVETVDLPPF